MNWFCVGITTQSGIRDTLCHRTFGGSDRPYRHPITAKCPATVREDHPGCETEIGDLIASSCPGWPASSRKKEKASCSGHIAGRVNENRHPKVVRPLVEDAEDDTIDRQKPQVRDGPQSTGGPSDNHPRNVGNGEQQARQNDANADPESRASPQQRDTLRLDIAPKDDPSTSPAMRSIQKKKTIATAGGTVH